MRDHNEDTFLIADLSNLNATTEPEVRTHRLGDRGSLFMVADGMGGAAAGEIASAMAVDTVLEKVRERWVAARNRDPGAFATALKLAADEANVRIHKYATEHPENRGMGTTATIAGVLGDTLYLAQVGDSRGYLVRDGVARQITKDQSLMQKLIEAGEMTEEQAEQSERRNIILQALGPEPSVRIDLTHQQVRRGDVLVLCSDGLSGPVRAEEIGRVVSEELDPVEICRGLIDRANENGGPDNITVVVVRLEGDGLAAPGDEDRVGHQAYMLSDATPTIPMERYEVRSTPSAALQASDPAGRASGGQRRQGASGARTSDAPGRPRALLVGFLLVALVLAAVAVVALRLTPPDTGADPAGDERFPAESVPPPR